MATTPFQARLLQVRNLGEAKRLLREALATGNREDLVAGNYPFDLDLAGMLFPIHNRGQRPSEPAEDMGLSPADLGAIVADAAWELCLEGVLRPGSYSPSDKTVHQSTGYCLTEHGRRALASEEGT